MKRPKPIPIFSALITGLFLTSCVNLPNLNPSINDDIILQEVEELSRDLESGSILLDNPATGSIVEIAFREQAFSEPGVIYFIQVSTQNPDLECPGSGSSERCPGRILIDPLSESDGNLVEAKYLNPNQLVGGNIQWAQWNQKAKIAYEWFDLIGNEIDVLCSKRVCSGIAGCSTEHCEIAEKFIPFYFDDIDGRHFGWIQFSQSVYPQPFNFGSESFDMFIHSIAFSTVANRSVRMGEGV